MTIGNKWEFSGCQIAWGKDIDKIYPIFDKNLLNKNLKDKYEQIAKLIEKWDLDLIPKRATISGINAKHPDASTLFGIIKPNDVEIDIYKTYEELEENGYKRENYVLIYITRYIKGCRRVFLRFDKK